MRLMLRKITTFGLPRLMLSAALTSSVVAATDQAPSQMGTVPASSDGLQLQLESILNAATHGDSKAVDELVDAFIRSILSSAKAPVVLYTASSGKKSGTDSLPGVYIFEQGTFVWPKLIRIPGGF
jgi:hypothetical protein